MKKIITLIIFITLIIIVIFLCNIFKFQNVVLTKIYPKDYSEHVEKYASEYDIDPLLIYAIIKAESNFHPDVKSNSGAIGLMQIMEKTAHEMGDTIGITLTGKESELFEPDINIQLGTAYFNKLLKQYDNNIQLALIAYNAGPGNVEKWIKEGIIKEDGSDIENVPFKETNTYVRKILRNYEIYKDIH